LLQRPGKLGLGTAYKDGLKLASGDFIINMDADLSHHPKYIPKMVEEMQKTGCDVVYGTRYTKNAGTFGWGVYRKLMSRVANFVASFFMGDVCSDLTGSFRLYKRRVIEPVFAEVQSKGYAFQMEIIYRTLAKGFSIKPVRILL
jgi:dolichol-phosphate mannosyltransferase